MLFGFLLITLQVIALVVGFVRGDIHLTIWIGLGGTVLAMLAVVPPWPVYNQHPQPWVGSMSRNLRARSIIVQKKSS